MKQLLKWYSVGRKSRGETVQTRHKIAVPLFLFLAIFSLVSPLIFSTSASAVQTAPYTINYQGRLTNSSGTPVSNGSYNMTFRLYSASSGGSPVWSSVYQTTDRITVTNGQFNVQLGTVSGQGLTPSLFSSYPLYLEVELPSPATATCSTSSCANYNEGPMTPRQPLASSAYAMNSDTLDGVDGSSFARNDASNTFTATQLVKPSSNATSAFAVQNTGSANVLTVNTSNQRVGVGNITAGGGPAATLEVKSINTETLPALLVDNNGSGNIASFQNAGTNVAWINSSGMSLQYTSTDALVVQKAAAADVVLKVDSSNNRVTIGNATGTDTNTTLFVLDSATADPTTGLSNGSMYYNSSTGKFRCRQAGGWTDCISNVPTTKYVTLVPEYQGAVLTADGTNNSVTVTSESVSGLNNVNSQGYKHNFYQWSTSSGTAQDYDIVINYQLPSDFTSFVSSSFSVWVQVGSQTSTNATFTMRSANDTSCYSSPASIKPANANWTQMAPGNPGNGCTFAANDLVTFVITPTVISPSTNKVNIGEIRFAYQ